MEPMAESAAKEGLFQRRHYEAIAAVVRLAMSKIDGLNLRDPEEGAALVTAGLSSLFAEDNPRFNRERFINATIPTR